MGFISRKKGKSSSLRNGKLLRFSEGNALENIRRNNIFYHSEGRKNNPFAWLNSLQL